MIKSIITATALVVAIAPIANADSREEFDVAINYDRSQLETETGVEAVTRSIEEQAREVCVSLVAGSRMERVDAVCVAEIVESRPH